MTREQAIEIVKTQYPHDHVMKTALGLLIPELRESDGERTRKWILEYLYDGLRKADEQFKDYFKSAIDWLEKQKEQKPSEWSEEDSKRYISIATTLETSAVLSKEDYDANMVWLRDLVNSQKYSSPQPHWKPSKEQMRAMKLFVEKHRDTANQLIGGWSLFDTFESLYNDLLKLM